MCLKDINPVPSIAFHDIPGNILTKDISKY